MAITSEAALNLVRRGYDQISGRRAAAQKDEDMAKHMLLAELPGDKVEWETGPVRLVTVGKNNVINVRTR